MFRYYASIFFFLLLQRCAMLTEQLIVRERSVRPAPHRWGLQTEITCQNTQRALPRRHRVYTLTSKRLQAHCLPRRGEVARRKSVMTAHSDRHGANSEGKTWSLLSLQPVASWLFFFFFTMESCHGDLNDKRKCKKILNYSLWFFSPNWWSKMSSACQNAKRCAATTANKYWYIFKT